MQQLLSGFLAGICISIGCNVYLYSDNNIIGAILFAVALLSICSLKLSLYTGKIGFVIDKHSKTDILNLFLCLIGNIIGVSLVGFVPGNAASLLLENMCFSKLSNPWYITLFNAGMCGILMYIAVWIYNNKHSIVGIISGGYSNAYYLNTINSQVLATMTESDEDGTLKAALKTVDVKHTGGYGDYWEDHIYTTQIFAPAVREIYSGLAGAANKYTYVCDDTYYPYVIQEGQTFEWFLVDDHTTEYQKRAAFSLTSQNFWTRTTYMKNNRTDSFCSIQSNGGVGASMASGVNQIVMCFVIG